MSHENGPSEHFYRDIWRIGHSALFRFWLNYLILMDFQIQHQNKMREYKVNHYVVLNLRHLWYLDTNGDFIALSMCHIS